MLRHPKLRDNRTPERYRSALYLTAEGVTALVVERRGDTAVVWGSAHRTWPPDEAASELAVAVSVCDEALCAAEDMTAETAGRKIVPDAVLIAVLPHDLYTARGSARTRRADPSRPVDQEEARRLLSRAWQVARQKTRPLNRTTPSASETPDLDVVDVVESLTVDGLQVNGPVGLHGRELAAEIFVTLAPADELASLRNLATALELDEPAFVSWPFALGQSLPQRDALLIALGAAGHQVVVVRGGRPVDMAAGPGGERALVSAYDEAVRSNAPLGAPSNDLAAALRAYQGGELREPEMKVWRRAFRSSADHWVQDIVATIEVLESEGPFPAIFLQGWGWAYPEVVAALRDALSQKGICQPCPIPRILSARDVPAVLNRADQTEDVILWALARSAAFNPSESTLLRQAIGQLSYRRVGSSILEASHPSRT